VLELCNPFGIFAGFALSGATRIIDSDCKMVITLTDGGYRGDKTIELKAH
jgi:acetyl-CoA synthetase